MTDITIEEIKAKYPNPVVSFPGGKKPEHSDCYCVGGAFFQTLVCKRDPNLKELPSLMRFPTTGELANALIDARPRLAGSGAYVFSSLIIRQNDRGEFDRAWEYLEEALSYE